MRAWEHKGGTQTRGMCPAWAATVDGQRDTSLEHATFPPVSSPSRFLPCAGVNTGAVGSYIYDKDPEAKNQP